MRQPGRIPKGRSPERRSIAVEPNVQSTADILRRFVLIRMDGRTNPGYLAGETAGAHGALCAVYLPTRDLFGGGLVLVPAEDVIRTELTPVQRVGTGASASDALAPHDAFENSCARALLKGRRQR